MAGHLFVDESKERAYLLVAVRVEPEHVASLRTVMRSHLRPGQRSIHFAKEQNATRSDVLRTIKASPISVVVYRARICADELAVREAVLRMMARDARGSDAAMVVIDRDDSLAVHDRKWLFHELRGTAVRYEHRHRHEDPLLWIPDAIAWCLQRGGAWLGRLEGTIIDVVDVNSR